MCPAVVSGIVTGTRCVSAIGRAPGQLLYWTRCVSAIGRAAGQLLASFFFLVTFREVFA